VAAHGAWTEQEVLWLNRAVEYQLWHSVVLVGVVAVHKLVHPRVWIGAALGFVIGILCFCGSLYSLAFSGPAWIAALAPFGGVSFMVGWLTLGLAAALMRFTKV